MDRLALPIFPPTVPASENMLFLFDVGLFGEVDNNEWDGERPVAASHFSGLVPSGLPGEGGFDSSRVSPFTEPAKDVGFDTALSMLSLWDRVAIANPLGRSRPEDKRTRGARLNRHCVTREEYSSHSRSQTPGRCRSQPKILKTYS